MDYKIQQVCYLLTQHSNFKPEFCFCDSIDEVADCINKPHEDYPNRVYRTKQMIIESMNFIVADVENITEHDIRQIHGAVFDDTHHGGRYRNFDVHPKGSEIENSHRMVYTPHYRIPEQLKSILPINIKDFSKDREKLLEDITLWYKAFQTIHPFEDGNGRVGGIIAAILWYYNYGIIHPEEEWLGPKQ